MNSRTRTCKCCTAFQALSEDEGRGVCRRHAPRPLANVPNGTEDGWPDRSFWVKQVSWPVVKSTCFCLEWEPDVEDFEDDWAVLGERDTYSMARQLQSANDILIRERRKVFRRDKVIAAQKRQLKKLKPIEAARHVALNDTRPEKKEGTK